jgi:hypothetical protein
MAFERNGGAAAWKLIVSCVMNISSAVSLKSWTAEEYCVNVHELFMSPFRKATICSMRLLTSLCGKRLLLQSQFQVLVLPRASTGDRGYRWSARCCGSPGKSEKYLLFWLNFDLVCKFTIGPLGRPGPVNRGMKWLGLSTVPYTATAVL